MRLNQRSRGTRSKANESKRKPPSRLQNILKLLVLFETLHKYDQVSIIDFSPEEIDQLAIAAMSGEFGPKTKARIKDYCDKHGLESTWIGKK